MMNGNRLTEDVWDLDAGAFPTDGDVSDQIRFLLRYAILAPSSHNSQPWTFAIHDREVSVSPDESRWLRQADADKRELFISLGCAVENLCIAAERFGFAPTVTYPLTEENPRIAVRLDPDGPISNPRPSVAFDQMTERRTTHQPFEDRKLSETALARLASCVFEDDVTVSLVADPGLKQRLAKRQARADEALMADPDYRRELGHWIGIGALGQSRLTARVGQLVITHLDLGSREGQKNSRRLKQAPVLGIFTTDRDNQRDRIRVGQAFERLALVAHAEGIAVHPLSQVLERPATKSAVSVDLGLETAVPQHLIRLGYPTTAGRHTPRWPLDMVLG